MSNPESKPLRETHTPIVGVIIPTFNRLCVLMRCLECLEAQSLRNFEVIVVDDGSTDDTAAAMRDYAKRTSLSFRYVHQENAGPAAARNHAVSLLRAQLCVMIGDDILVAHDFLEQHVALHERVSELRAAGLGLTRWSEKGQTVTPFMRWLDEHGVQFAYKELQGGVCPTWKHFYTSNLSLKTEQLRRHPFNEIFQGAGMEDIELGYRLAQANELTMYFLPYALGDHVHPTNVSSSCRRLINVGCAAHAFDRLWPEQAESHIENGWRGTLRLVLTEETVVLPLLRVAAGLLTSIWCPNQLLIRVMALHYRLGYRHAEVRHSRGSKGEEVRS